jgi:hypothetical protein
MVPVITAIIAALLAGVVAFARERRLELRRLLVAARLVRDALTHADITMQIFGRHQPPLEWATVTAIAEFLDVPKVWDAHADVLAGHLSISEWDTIGLAVSSYLSVLVNAKDPTTSPNDLRDRFANAQRHTSKAIAVIEPYCRTAGSLRNPGHATRGTGA